jgi:hypothetical protein
MRGVTVQQPLPLPGATRRRRRGETVNEPLVVLVLVLIWAGLLVPSAFRSRSTSPHATVGGFERAMDVLRTDVEESNMGRTPSGRGVMVPGDAGRIVERPLQGDVSTPPPPLASMRQSPVQARREAWFIRALAGVVATLVLSIVFGGWAWPLFVIALIGTAGYVGVLRHFKLQRDEARRVVADLDLHRDQAVIDVSDRATGTSGMPAGVGAGATADPWAGSTTVRLRRWDD